LSVGFAISTTSVVYTTVALRVAYHNRLWELRLCDDTLAYSPSSLSPVARQLRCPHQTWSWPRLALIAGARLLAGSGRFHRLLSGGFLSPCSSLVIPSHWHTDDQLHLYLYPALGVRYKNVNMYYKFALIAVTVYKKWNANTTHILWVYIFCCAWHHVTFL